MMDLVLQDLAKKRIVWIKEGILGFCRWGTSPIVYENFNNVVNVHDASEFIKYWNEYIVSSSDNERLEQRELVFKLQNVLHQKMTGQKS